MKNSCGKTSEELRVLGNQGFALACRMLHHRDDAADAVQDAMHQMIRKWSSFESQKGSLKAWFLTIVRNRCIDMRRRKRAVSGMEIFDPVDMKTPSGDDLAMQDELISKTRHALAGMPESAREIILLRDFDGLSYGEIAQVLGIAQGTVMSRLHRARQQLANLVLSNNGPKSP